MTNTDTPELETFDSAAEAFEHGRSQRPPTELQLKVLKALEGREGQYVTTVALAKVVGRACGFALAGLVKRGLLERSYVPGTHGGDGSPVYRVPPKT